MLSGQTGVNNSQCRDGGGGMGIEEAARGGESSTQCRKAWF